MLGICWCAMLKYPASLVHLVMSCFPQYSQRKQSASAEPAADWFDRRMLFEFAIYGWEGTRCFD